MHEIAYTSQQHNHDTHLLTESQSEYVIYLSKYGFVIVNDCIPYIIENDIFLIYSEIVMSRDWQMAWNHDIQNELSVHQPSIDYG